MSDRGVKKVVSRGVQPHSNW